METGCIESQTWRPEDVIPVSVILVIVIHVVPPTSDVCFVWYRASSRERVLKGQTTGVFEKTLLLHKPSPCSPAAETALQSLIWCSDN